LTQAVWPPGDGERLAAACINFDQALISEQAAIVGGLADLVDALRRALINPC
jgi:hypothetical protein